MCDDGVVRFSPFDMDKLEIEVKLRNKEVDQNRKNALVRCEACGMKLKGNGALKMHQKKCCEV